MMIDNKKIEEMFRAHGVRITALRVLIFRAMLQHHNTFSLQDIDDELDTVDRSSIFRAITLFASHHLLHEVEDGSGSRKYCVCHNDHPCSPAEMHVHFVCRKCHTTYCLDSVAVPPVSMPAGFSVDGVEYILKGVCAACGGK